MLDLAWSCHRIHGSIGDRGSGPPRHTCCTSDEAAPVSAPSLIACYRQESLFWAFLAFRRACARIADRATYLGPPFQRCFRAAQGLVLARRSAEERLACVALQTTSTATGSLSKSSTTWRTSGRLLARVYGPTDGREDTLRRGSIATSAINHVASVHFRSRCDARFRPIRGGFGEIARTRASGPYRFHRTSFFLFLFFPVSLVSLVFSMGIRFFLPPRVSSVLVSLPSSSPRTSGSSAAHAVRACVGTTCGILLECVCVRSNRTRPRWDQGLSLIHI